MLSHAPSTILRYLIHAINPLRLRSIDSLTILPTHLIDRLPQPINTPQRLMFRKCVPRVQLHLVFPESSTFSSQRILRRELNGSNGLVGCSSFVPNYRAVFGGVVGGVCAELDLEGG